MQTTKICVALFSIFLILPNDLNADSVVLDASLDNTIYEDNTSNSNGAGDFIFAGQNGDGSPRRALLSFDFSSIPSNAIIESVTLNLTASQVGSDVATDVSLHRVTSDWGESTSDATGGEGGGTAAAIDDATWDFSFFDNQNWNTPGGDFITGPSATTVVGVTGDYSWTGPGLVGDVQGWLDGTNSNFGWILIGDETAIQTSKRFNSRTNGANNPSLSVRFSVVPEPTSACILIAGLAGLVARRRR